ncbi:MAG: diacylglycerol/lipid kinase family protein [Nocardioidaceae bacterium]
MDRAVLITNRSAGTSEERSIDDAVQVLHRGGCDVVREVCEDVAGLAGILERRSGRDVVVAGGDGSLHAMVGALHRRRELDKPSLGLIPLGTGNDFARGCGLPLDAAEAAGVILHGRQTPVDIFLDDSGGVVVNAVHVGVGADAGKEAASWKERIGRSGYLVGALVAGFKVDGHMLRVVVDGTVLADGSRRVLQVGVSNGPYVGGGCELNPDAVATDGLADVVVSFSVSPLDRLAYGVHLKRGTHHRRNDVRAARATKIEVTGIGDAFWCNTDGEVAGPFRERSWTVLPAAYRLMLPPSTG